MWLLDKFLRKLITKGELIVTDHDGTTRRYGSPDPNASDRSAFGLTDSRDRGRALRAIPASRSAKPMSTGGIVIEGGSDIRDFLLLMIYNAPFEE